jgi:hypothetical protein
MSSACYSLSLQSLSNRFKLVLKLCVLLKSSLKSEQRTKKFFEEIFCFTNLYRIEKNTSFLSFYQVHLELRQRRKEVK